MQLIHTLADTGQDGSDPYAECTCGMRSWGETPCEAYDAFLTHREAATLHRTA